MAFIEILGMQEDELSHLNSRLFALEAFKEQLDGATREKPFIIWNSIAWTMVFDSRDMHVIHLSSWANVLLGRKGLFETLKQRHLAELIHSQTLPPNQLLPEGLGTPPTAGQIDAIVSKLKSRLAPVIVDRNKNRADVFETPLGIAKLFKLDELRSITNDIEEIFNALRLKCAKSTYGYGDRNAVPSNAAARELVLSLLFGPDPRRTVVVGTRDPFEVLEEMHQRHDAVQKVKIEKLFNA